MLDDIEELDELLTREPLSRKLKERGYPVASKTLATMATRGGGPPYQKFGSRPLYRWGDALAWANSRLSKRVCSTSELEVPSPKSHKGSQK